MSDRASPAKLLAIGLDAADASLLLRWSEDGTMPNLGALRREGAWCRVVTPPGVGDDAVWGSFSTGVSPAEHGRFYFKPISPGSYATPYRGTERLEREPFWSALARRGRRVAVLDAPKSGLSKEPGVVQVADWRCHGRSGLPASNPPDLARELIARFGDDGTDVYEGGGRHCFREGLEGDVETFLAELEDSVAKKLEATEWLLGRAGWDLFLVVFKEAHCAGHLCWDEADPEQRPLRRIYRALDGAIGRLVARVAGTAPVVVFSDLGMSTNGTGEHVLEQVLARLEPLVLPSRARLRGKLARLRRMGARASDRATGERAYRGIYTLDHNERSGAIRVNVKGREPGGFVARGRELRTVCDRLAAELSALVDVEDGRPLVERVIRCSRANEGERDDALPDLLVLWRRSAPIRGARSEAVGEIRAQPPRLRPGNHVEGGIVFARARGVARGVELPPIDIVDLAPTLAAGVGVRLEGLRGRPLVGITPFGDDDDRARP